MHIKYKYNGSFNKYAKELRKNMTKEERRLWYCYLCDCPIKFYRQKIIGEYIIDFYCDKAKLAIELDGSQHGEDEHVISDTKRDSYLSSLGITVVRISNRQINENFRGVCEYLQDLITELPRFP